MEVKGHKLKSVIKYLRHITLCQHKLELGISCERREGIKGEEKGEWEGREPQDIFIYSIQIEKRTNILYILVK